MENTKYGRRREGRWTPIWAKAQDTRANPNSWETYLVRKRWDIGLLWALSVRIMMMISTGPLGIITLTHRSSSVLVSPSTGTSIASYSLLTKVATPPRHRACLSRRKILYLSILIMDD